MDRIRLTGGTHETQGVDSSYGDFYSQGMVIHLTVEQETQLSQVAALAGKGADELAREMLLHSLRAETIRIAATPSASQTQDAISRILELRRENTLPDGVTIHDLIHEGRA